MSLGCLLSPGWKLSHKGRGIETVMELCGQQRHPVPNGEWYGEVFLSVDVHIETAFGVNTCCDLAARKADH